MPFDIARQLLLRSDRVKCVDAHGELLLCALYSGKVTLLHRASGTLLKTLPVSPLPVRTARFIARRSWVVAGSDDMALSVWNYNTAERVHVVEGAHADYIRSIAVHPTQPLILSASDDMTIRLWDWDKAWKCVGVFEGHSHYVMKVVWNPKDTNVFASASQDRTVKVWSVGSTTANFTLEGHEKGLNYVDYYHGSERPFLITAADDKTAKVWDYQTKACVHTIEGHTQNVAAALFHPALPVILTASEDGTVKVWHSVTYRLQTTLNYGLDRAWTMACISRGSTSEIIAGYDEGMVLFKMGKDEPAISMDASGKIIWARHAEIQTANVKAVIATDAIRDGDRLSLPIKDLGSCEIYPQSLYHSPNGRFVSVCGDGEYIVYTALAWRNKTFGQAQQVVWAADSNEYAVKESATRVKLFKAFKERPAVFPKGLGFSVEKLFGGALLAIAGSSFFNLYDWDSGALVRRIDVVPLHIFWSDAGDLVTIACEDAAYILRFDRAAYLAYFEASGGDIADDGVEEAFELVAELAETIRSGHWVGDCFVYTNAANRLNYLVGSETFTIAHFDTDMFLLGYLPKDNRVYLADKDANVVSYYLSLAVVEYQTAILRNDIDTADQLLPDLPHDQRSRVARFLESQDRKELALQVSTDDDHRFDLALQLKQLDVALTIVNSAASEQKYKALGDAALAAWQFSLAEECYRNAGDTASMLLVYQACGDAEGMARLADLALDQGLGNIAFSCFLQIGQLDRCIDLLCDSGRIPDAVLFARSYAPSALPRLVQLWKASLVQRGRPRTAEMIADHHDMPDSVTDEAAEVAEAADGVIADATVEGSDQKE